MTDPDATGRPRLRRSALRHLRDSLVKTESRFSAAVTPPQASPDQSAAPDPAEQGGTVLTVCTGNICRSPMGEMLLRSALADLGIRVHSAGTHALVDESMTDPALQLAIVHGADAEQARAHRARLLSPPLLAETDLVLTMTREHRSHVVQLVPALLHRTFTVREFARLVEPLTDDDVRRGVADAGPDAGLRLQALARLAGAQRGMVHAQPDEHDVIDPYRRSQQTYELCASQLVPAVAEVSRVIRAALS
ncbi:low molecular weight phosphatase family protein [Microbacterium sp. YJN-G]|uniref:arsenate reductase/protein-tyrosine-phosphatase family protein n=1 Tax=Microbacterium sp. YJN-G TaxID=2763257 RepID=UPI001878E43F|nr:low molecular weight phosphatase family protein [Microbacterium sp. YJN-G]